MGLLSKLFGSRDKSAQMTFDLTDDEQVEVNKIFDMFKGYSVHPDIAEKLQHGLIARGLADYASSQILYADIRKQDSKDYIKKAIASIGKAYSIYQLPIYLFDLASYFELADMESDAKKTYSLFLRQQAAYKYDQLDNLFLQNRNINEAIAHAVQKTF